MKQFFNLIVLGIVFMIAGSALAQAPNGGVPKAKQKQIASAVATQRTASKKLMLAEQAFRKATAATNDTIQTVQNDLELDQSWEFNPNYLNPKSSDYKAIKYIPRPAPVMPPAPPPTPAPANLKLPTKALAPAGGTPAPATK